MVETVLCGGRWVCFVLVSVLHRTSRFNAVAILDSGQRQVIVRESYHH
jgi:hypothetical protein